MHDWLGLLAPIPPVVKTARSTEARSRRKVEGRSPAQKEALALRICNQMFRQVPYPEVHLTHERINEEAHMTKGQAERFVKKYMKTNKIQPVEAPHEEV